MEKEKIHELKRELLQRPAKELVEICLSLAKLKTENKEMLGYLLFDAENPMDYANRMKLEVDAQFETLNPHYYYSTKTLRKTLRLINKFSRFSKHKQGEIELLICFSRNYCKAIPASIKHLPLLGLQYRSLHKMRQLIGKLHEDLFSDYAKEWDSIYEETCAKYSHWPTDKFVMSSLSK